MCRLMPVNGSSVSHVAIPLLFLVSGVVPAEQLPIKAYTTAEGLAHNQINRIRQDSRGYLWFCTARLRRKQFRVQEGRSPL